MFSFTGGATVAFDSRSPFGGGTLRIAHCVHTFVSLAFSHSFLPVYFSLCRFFVTCQSQSQCRSPRLSGRCVCLVLLSALGFVVRRLSRFCTAERLVEIYAALVSTRCVSVFLAQLRSLSVSLPSLHAFYRLRTVSSLLFWHHRVLCRFPLRLCLPFFARLKSVRF